MTDHPYRTPGRAHDFREPLTSSEEFAPIEIAEGESLDALAATYGVTRLFGEPDVSLRERVRDTLSVARASEKVRRGESLVPPMVEASGSAWEVADQLRQLLAAKDGEIMRLRATLIDARIAAAREQWARVLEILDAASRRA